MSTESNHQSHGHHSTSAAAPATDIVDEHGHGHSVAAWAGVAVCLVGSSSSPWRSSSPA